jgi:hypothetical protein
LANAIKQQSLLFNSDDNHLFCYLCRSDLALRSVSSWHVSDTATY